MGGGVLPIMAFLGGSAHRDPFLRVEVQKRVGTSQSKSLNSSIAKVEVGCVRNPGASTFGGQLLYGDHSHGWQILATQL